MVRLKHTLVWYTEVGQEDLSDYDAETFEEAAENQVKWINDGRLDLLEEVEVAGDDAIYTAEVENDVE